VATIRFNKDNMTITNNSGNSNYTFTKNGEFTFMYKDKYGVTGSATARVNWILEKDFTYVGDCQTYTIPYTGAYFLEVW
jgi:hypothetical protein